MTHRPAAAGLATIAALAIASCASPDAAPSGEGPSAALATLDGLTVQLSVERTELGAGEDLGVIVAVQNLGREPVRWRAGGCDLRASVAVVPTDAAAVVGGIAEMPDGDDGDRLVARFIAVVAGPGDGVAPSRTIATTTPAAGRACQIDHGFAVLAPGERLEERAAWSATTAAGAPLSPGPYEMRATFPMLGRDSPLVPAAFRAERDLRPVIASVEIDIDEASRHISISGADALRTLLEQTSLGAWVRSGTISAADAHLAYDGNGWTITVQVPTGGTAAGRVSADGRSVTDLRSAP